MNPPANEVIDYTAIAHAVLDPPDPRAASPGRLLERALFARMT